MPTPSQLIKRPIHKQRWNQSLSRCILNALPLHRGHLSFFFPMVVQGLWIAGTVQRTIVP